MLSWKRKEKKKGCLSRTNARLKVRDTGKVLNWSELVADELRRGGGIRMHSASRQGHARGDYRGRDEAHCTPRMTFLPEVTSLHSPSQRRQFPGDCTPICGYVL